MPGLEPGGQTWRLVMRDDADPGSKGKKPTIGFAVVYLSK